MKTILEPAFDTPLVSFQVVTRQGSAAEAAGTEGMIHHTAELSMRGAGQRSRSELDESIDALGASIGFGVRRDFVCMQANCLGRHLDAVVDLAHDLLHQPRLENDEHEKLRRESLHDLDELRDEDESLVQRFFAKFCAPGHVYSRTALGTSESLQAIDLESVRSLHPQIFRNDELILAMTGALTDDIVESVAGRLSGPSEITPRAAVEWPEPEPCVGRRLIIVDKPARQQCQVAIGHMLPAYGSSDFELLRVAEAAFGGMFTSRLMQEIRVKNGWSYGAHCSMNRGRVAHWMQLGLAPAADVCAPAIARTLEMLTELAREGLAEDEFEFTRSYLIGSAAFGRATSYQRMFRRVHEEVLDLPSGYADGFAERLKTSSCSAVNQAVSRCLHPDDLCVVVVASADQILSSLEGIGFDSVEVVDFKSY